MHFGSFAFLGDLSAIAIWLSQIIPTKSFEVTLIIQFIESSIVIFSSFLTLSLSLSSKYFKSSKGTMSLSFIWFTYLPEGNVYYYIY